MIILGIDPGLRKTGFGVIKKVKAHYSFIDAGVILLDNIKDLHDRLFELYQKVECLFHAYKPNCLSLEKVFIGKNARSAFLIGEARAACIIAAKKFNVPVFEYAARSVKQGIAGYGAADKEDVNRVIKIILGLKGEIKEDASDALALAIFHGNIDYVRSLQ